jgi:hypothetical protein
MNSGLERFVNEDPSTAMTPPTVIPAKAGTRAPTAPDDHGKAGARPLNEAEEEKS